MRQRKQYLYPILRGLLFPVIVIGTIMILDDVGDQQWFHGSEVKISARQAVGIARAQCSNFAYMPVLLDKRTRWHSRLNDKKQWLVVHDDLPWYEFWGRPSWGAYALIDARDGRVIECRTWAA